MFDMSTLIRAVMHLFQPPSYKHVARRRAAASPSLRPKWGRHVLALAAGGACFAAEDAAIARDIDLLHPLWHCLACYAVAGTSALITR